MELTEFLYGKREELSEKWYKAIIETFPADSSKFFIDMKDKFANPMGYAFTEELPFIFDGIFGKGAQEKYESAIENVIRIRAVQDLSPAKATGCIALLKNILREAAAPSLTDKKSFDAMLELESKIDEALGLSFNCYMKMKEKLYEIKANETKNTFGKMIDKLNAKYDKNLKN